MGEMIERVARAMAAAIVSQARSGATFDETPCLMISDEDSNSFWELLPVARAAVEAMREPTDLMGLGLPDDYKPGSHSATQIWRGMIDAALDQDGRVKR